jgi:hypothetical protein
MAKCQGAQKATVKIKSKQEETIVSKSPAIEIIATPGGGMKITVGGMGVDFDWSAKYVELSCTDPSGTSSDQYSLRKFNCTIAIGCGSDSPHKIHGYSDQARIFKNGEHFHTFLVIGWYSVSILRVEPIKSNLKITDSSGATIYDKEYDSGDNKPPEYEVSCDDECPEGQMKCPCNRPPGYCCIPCESLKAQVFVISSLIRQ